MLSDAVSKMPVADVHALTTRHSDGNTTVGEGSSSEFCKEFREGFESRKPRLYSSLLRCPTFLSSSESRSRDSTEQEIYLARNRTLFFPSMRSSRSKR